MEAGVTSYRVTGMTCMGCVATVRNALSKLPDVLRVEVSLDPAVARITSKGPLVLTDLNAGLRGTHYHVEEALAAPRGAAPAAAAGTSWFVTYRPLLLVLVFIPGVSIISAWSPGGVDLHAAMRNFMAGFFLVFSFFKFLDLPGFARSYAGYDLLAMRWKAYGYVYPFLELALGLAYLWPGLDNGAPHVATIGLMGFSTIGVLRAVVNKQRIQCACLGTVFALPMSTVTIIEDLLMVAMAGAMLLMH